jgi:hypothetical protein
VIAISDRFRTTPEAVAVLFASTGSVVAADTVAVLDKVASAIPPLNAGATAAVTVIVAVCPTLRVPTVQLRGLALVQVPTSAVAPVNVVEPGSVSATTTPVAVDGPSFVTFMVHVTEFPAVTGSGD